MPAEILVNDIRKAYDWFADSTNFREYFGDIDTASAFRQPELAATLRRIAEYGADDFYRGETARLIVQQMAASGGLISAEDLETYTAEWRKPVRAAWRDYEIVSAPPPSSGGFAVVQLLKMKDYLDHFFTGLEHNDPQYIHLVAENGKTGFRRSRGVHGRPRLR